jgi:hypothetical protein
MNGKRFDPSDEDAAFFRRFHEPPRPEFARALSERLAHDQVDFGSVHGGRVRAWRGIAVARPWLAAAVVVLMLGAILAVPAMAYWSIALPHSAPREVFPATPGGAPVLTPSGAVTDAPTPAGRRFESLDDLARATGLPLLLPTYLPSGCAERERFGLPTPVNAAYLTYSCLTLSQQAIVRQGTEHREEPAIGAGAAEAITIGGQPAIYIRGAWMVDSRGQRVWQEHLGHELVFERDGLIVRLRAGDATAVPLAELIRVAESLQPRK